SQASTTITGADSVGSPAATAASGPAPGGSSLAQPTGRAVSRRGPTTVVRPAREVASSARSSSDRPAISTPGLSAPPSRRPAPPARTIASYAGPGSPAGSLTASILPRPRNEPATDRRQRGDLGQTGTVRVSLLQYAAGQNAPENLE